MNKPADKHNKNKDIQLKSNWQKSCKVVPGGDKSQTELSEHEGNLGKGENLVPTS